MTNPEFKLRQGMKKRKTADQRALNQTSPEDDNKYIILLHTWFGSNCSGVTYPTSSSVLRLNTKSCLILISSCISTTNLSWAANCADFSERDWIACCWKPGLVPDRTQWWFNKVKQKIHISFWFRRSDTVFSCEFLKMVWLCTRTMNQTIDLVPVPINAV